jgi:hypothetical protein
MGMKKARLVAWQSSGYFAWLFQSGIVTELP